MEKVVKAENEKGIEGESTETDHVGTTNKKENDSSKTEKEKKATLFTLFRYRTKLDTFLLVQGTLMALATGCMVPFVIILFGRVISSFVSAANSNNGTSINVTDPFATAFDDTLPTSIQFYVFAAATFVTGSLSLTSFAYVGERQIQQIRIHFFRSVMRQDITWFETHKSGELNTRFSEDTQAIYESMGLRLTTFVVNIATCISCIVSSFIFGWKLSLVCLSFSPVIIVVASLAVKFLRNLVQMEMQKYASAGNVATEAFTAIRTVHAFQGQEKECKRYDQNLEAVKNMSGKRGLAIGFNIGTFWFIFFANFGISLWYITQLIQTEGLDPGALYPIIILVMRGSGTLGVALPFLESLSKSLASGSKVFAVIDAIPQIDSSSDQGLKPNNVIGNVTFNDVSFNYPSRPNVKVLKNINLIVSQGKVVALVGRSGSGKSTVVQMLQRFYDPLGGQIMLDDHDIKDLNIRWLRHQFGVVSQEPVLFDTTITENIRYGNLDVNQELIEKAAREANAHNFISHLPKGYDTVVGDRGAQLSGGQKQRIAIARALVRNPKILLLDEATSALDHESEAVVQSALEQAERGRTTLVIAHRLSTVRNADLIVAIKHGEVVEQGTHDELIEKDGLYAQLVKLQMSEDMDENDLDEIQLDTDLENGIGLDETQETIPPSEKGQNLDDGCQDKTNIYDGHSSNKTKVKTELHNVSLMRLLRLNAPEWIFLLLGGLSAVIFGGMMPVLSFIISDFFRIFGLNRDPEEQGRVSVLLSVTLGGVGLFFALNKLLQSYCFAKSGAALTARIRSLAFKAIVNQDIDFFDEAENQVGCLVTRLASDAQLVQSATTVVGSMLEGLSTGLCMLVICFLYDWRMGLVTVIFIPLGVISGIGQTQRMIGVTDPEKTKTCGKICSEATDNIRTVASLCREDVFLRKYEHVINEMCRDGVKKAIIMGLAEGFQLSITFLTYGSILLFGSYLVQKGDMTFVEVIRIVIIVIMGSQQTGRALSSVDSYSKGKEAARRLFHIIDRPTIINSEKTQGKTLEDYSGAVSITDIWFRYKSRPKVKVLKGVSLDVRPGETVALVGSSGSGKSTIIQLIERFYDVERGSVVADKTPTPSLDLKWWRSQLAVVSQEPILFDCSIAENIAYGDNSRVVPMDEIIAAGRMANIHSFVEALPLGYETSVGSKGTQLSGGQKQRVAIARALIRNPKVLLLDEATSSLDSESERIIQETLDKAREGRTCLVIAHRLSTVQNADKIAVLQHGKIIEIGTHPELMEMRGAYFNQIMAQNRRKNVIDM